MTQGRKSPVWRLVVSAALIVGMSVAVPNFLPFGGSFPWGTFIPVAAIWAVWVMFLILSSRGWRDFVVTGISALMFLPMLGMFAEYRPSKTSELKSNLGAIRATQVAYYAEWNKYVGSQPSTPVADRSGNDKKEQWDATTRFSILGFAPEGKVYCSYSLEGPDYPTEAQGFTARAHCDLDGDGNVSVFTISSGSTDIAHSGADF